MSEYSYDLYCGLYCGACEVMNAETNEDKARVGEIFIGQI